ncbi:putative periplasmic serine endoprotease DegP-like precursor [compost metagenome]
MPLQLWRKGATREVTITVAELEPDGKARASRSAAPKEDSAQASKPNALGLVVNDLPDARLKELKLKSGVEVELADGPALRAGIRPGDIILRLGDTDVINARQFNELVRGLDKSRIAAVFVRRGDATQVLTLRPGATANR